MTGFTMGEWAWLLEQLRRLRAIPDGRWSLTCRRPGCAGTVLHGECRRCGGRLPRT